MMGFDSPEGQAAIAADFERLLAAFREFAEWCEQAAGAIVEAFQPLIKIILGWSAELRRLHLTPRQYKDTMQRRKLRKALHAGVFR